MKAMPESYLEHLRSGNTTLATCWQVEKSDGTFIRGTDHDRDITISEGSPSNPLGGTYRAAAGITGSASRSASDMSVDNMEVNGAIDVQLFGDITVADIESGLLDGVPVTTFRVNWQQPDDYQEIIRRGYLGEIKRTSEGQYTTEIRGLTQLLQQTIGRTAGNRCDVDEFGDARCKFNVSNLLAQGTVTAVYSDRRFDATLTFPNTAGSAGLYLLGKLTWTAGNNRNFTGQVKRDAAVDTLGQLEVWEPFFYEPEIGDTFDLLPGCDRRYLTCRDTFQNLVNFRGPAYFAPGMDAIIRAP